MIEKLNNTLDFLQTENIILPEIGIILGTGLGRLVNEIEIEKKISYNKIPHFPISTVESHKGNLIYGTLEKKKVLAMQGRFHYYEGYSLEEVTYPVRIMKMLGIKKLLISNAAGAMNTGYKKGELMLLDDHINFLPDNPLRGKNWDELGPRFPDMSCPYSEEIGNKLIKIAEEEGIILHSGIYVAVMGPNFETRAEYRMFRDYADAVGMSTVPEVIVANHMGLECAAISVLTDECDPDNLVPATLEEILEAAGKAEVNLITLFKKLIPQL